jgi:hypothetical protein
MQVIIREYCWRWDRARRILWWDVKLTDESGAQQTWSVGLPLAKVAHVFYEALNEPDIKQELHATAGEVGALEILGSPEIGAPESVDGFLSGIKKAFKKATRPVRKAVKRATRTLAKTGLQALKGARTVVRSKYTGYGLMALSVAMPAVGGPALAAYATARAIDNRARDAQRIYNTLRGRKPSRTQAHVLNRASQYAYRAKQLSRSNTPMARMMMAGLRSVV